MVASNRNPKSSWLKLQTPDVGLETGCGPVAQTTGQTHFHMKFKTSTIPYPSNLQYNTKTQENEKSLNNFLLKESFQLYMVLVGSVGWKDPYRQ